MRWITERRFSVLDVLACMMGLSTSMLSQELGWFVALAGGLLMSCVIIAAWLVFRALAEVEL